MSEPARELTREDYELLNHARNLRVGADNEVNRGRYEIRKAVAALLRFQLFTALHLFGDAYVSYGAARDARKEADAIEFVIWYVATRGEHVFPRNNPYTTLKTLAISAAVTGTVVLVLYLAYTWRIELY